MGKSSHFFGTFFFFFCFSFLFPPPPTYWGSIRPGVVGKSFAETDGERFYDTYERSVMRTGFGKSSKATNGSGWYVPTGKRNLSKPGEDACQPEEAVTKEGHEASRMMFLLLSLVSQGPRRKESKCSFLVHLAGSSGWSSAIRGLV